MQLPAYRENTGRKQHAKHLGAAFGKIKNMEEYAWFSFCSFTFLIKCSSHMAKHTGLMEELYVAHRNGTGALGVITNI